MNRIVFVAVAAVVLLYALFEARRGVESGSGDPASPTVTVYCAHDAAFAEPILKAFERETGIAVQIRFDEEANKSLGLTNLLLSERRNPRCDVFWNNQTLGTMRLQQAGVLQPYHSLAADRIPKRFKDADGHWTGFAGRLRVYLVNTEAMEATESAIQQLLSSDDLSRVAIAKPQFGTTLSHYSLLAAQQGLDWLKQWHADLHRRGIREVRGNSMTRDLVAEGVCDVGFTDTDDAFGAIDAGRPVQMLPVRMPSGATICLPNSVALIEGCAHPDAGRQLIDYLLSEAVEVKLANSPARQIPLGAVDESSLPEELSALQEWSSQAVDFAGAVEVNQQVLDWLTAEHTGQ